MAPLLRPLVDYRPSKDGNAMSASDSRSIRTFPHEVVRLTIPVPTTFSEFRDSYERAVPALQADRYEQFKKERAGWDVVRAATEENAPHSFIRYWGTDVASLMELAAESRPCVEYLMGNHVFAQRMFRHDPSVMLYAPLRTAIYVDGDDRTWFTIDQPRTRFDSFDDPRIAQVGRELDAELADLLDHLGLPVPTELLADGN
ncbi:DUF302 domain-containing protein [Amycolatopsis rhabdoformis]|uniref:DUF302 domain-containing protein n=1 Tax=Amycolatopsis rhabdoformis TaxID=1448059 RepID=A0ABZ1I6I6_9PSEU|nr:DUF302 domain-containing protein [Amycolatopsis rhabdoformis]WSE29970.1 DUF302 domain-containing protein [Amycolatopsis rhabdoformis]